MGGEGSGCVSAKMTRIRLPGLPAGEGYMDWDERSVEDMVSIMRHRAAHYRMVADAIDGAADEDFQIDIVRGSIVQHHIRNLQPGRPT